MPWVQYNTSDGSISGWNSWQVSDTDLAAIGRAQVLYDGDPNGMMVDIATKTVVAAPPPPPPPADMLTHIFNALVQQGWIDPTTVNPALLAQANTALAVTGAKTIAIAAPAVAP